MNSGATAERVYEQLKALIMEGAFRPGERLDPSLLSQTLVSSVTPVRDALNRLTGERLVDTRIRGGFQIPPLDEPSLQDRYAWSSALLSLALRNAPLDLLDTQQIGHGLAGASIAARAATLFLILTKATGNSEYMLATQQFNDRMHAIRVMEPEIIQEAAEEIDQLTESAARRDTHGLRRSITLYHRRRHRHAAKIVRAMYRPN